MSVNSSISPARLLGEATIFRILLVRYLTVCRSCELNLISGLSIVDDQSGLVRRLVMILHGAVLDCQLIDINFNVRHLTSNILTLVLNVCTKYSSFP